MITATVTRNHGYLEGVGRLRLHYRSWEVADAQAALVLVHGRGEHTGRYSAFGEAMGMAGFSTFALDLRGHGESEGRRGHVRRFAVFLQDLCRFRREVRGMVDAACPLFLLGHSMGGLIALRYLEEYDTPFHGAIITSPWLGTALRVPRWKAAAAPILNRVLPSAPFSAGIRAEDLCRDPKIADAYRHDALVHDTITPRLFHEASAAMGLAFERCDRIRSPLLFLVAGADRIVDCRCAGSFVAALRGRDVTLRVLPSHFHEVLNEEDRDALYAEIGDWVVAHAG